MDRMTMVALMMLGVEAEQIVQAEVAVAKVKIHRNVERKVFMARDAMESGSDMAHELNKHLDLDKGPIRSRKALPA